MKLPLWVVLTAIAFCSALIAIIVGSWINRNSPVGYEDENGYHDINPEDLKDQ